MKCMVWMGMLMWGWSCGVFADEAAPLLRDPFWPVGYRPPVVKAPEPQQAPEAVEPASSPLVFSELSQEDQIRVRNQLDVDGVMRKGSRFIAVINQQLVQRGDVLRVDLGDVVYRFRIQQISKNRVELSPIKEESNNPTKPKPGEAP